MITFEEIREKNKKYDTPQDPDVKSRPGTQPAPYYKGVAKSKKAARAAHFERGAKMDDDNPAAYTDAPGDKKARKEPMKKSKHTIKYHKMFGKKGDN